MSRVVAIAVALAACGDNQLPPGVPLAAARDLVIVAHQDDDLLFAEPDIIESVRRGTGVTTIYVTAGNGTKGADAADPRYDGLQSAYADAAGVARSAWLCGWIDLSGHVAQHCRLDDAHMSLVFLAYPDGGKRGEYANSLLHLWEGTIAGATTIAHETTYYTRDDLIATVAGVIATTQPQAIHTLEVASTHGRDHVDHMVVGALAVLAMAQAGTTAELISYRGYDSADEPANKLGALFVDDLGVLAHYEACAGGCGGSCGGACALDKVDPTHQTWLGRRYAVGFRRASGQIVASDGSGCLGPDALNATSALVIGGCSSTWELDANGELREPDLDLCARRQPDGTLALAGCGVDAGSRFYLDDEGHIWSGHPPAPQAGMELAHLDCLDAVGGAARLSLCGAAHAPTWDVVPLLAIPITHASLGLLSTGRAVRLADVTGDGKADLCAVEAGALVCATGDGHGNFTAAVRVDDPTAPLAIDPLSLAFGDIDGDGRPDACGLDANGIRCATAASGFKAAPWSTELGTGSATPATAPSLAIATTAGAPAVCALATTGVVCATPSGTTSLRSMFPDPDAAAWIGDLDGDGEADWCVATANGPTCGVFAERTISLVQGMPWGFALTGIVEGASLPLPDTTTTAIADIDGDGRADLCTALPDRVACARSQGRGLGPRATVLVLPAGVLPTALYLGDLDGDGKADACIDDGASIWCAAR